MIEIIIPELEELVETQSLRKYWTIEEETILKQYYGRVPTHELAKYLGRTKHAVEIKAGLLEVGFGKP
jgi:hypothetical protein